MILHGSSMPDNLVPGWGRTSETDRLGNSPWSEATPKDCNHAFDLHPQKLTEGLGLGSSERVRSRSGVIPRRGRSGVALR